MPVWQRAYPARAMALAVCPALAFVLLLIPQPLRFAPETWPSFYMDDFYYYVVIAQNVVSHGLSSFDGTTLTNGYHPLYMLLVASLLLLAGGAGNGFFILMIAMQVAAYAAAIWQVARLLIRQAVPMPMVIGATLLFAAGFSVAAITGMEVVIAVPLILAFVTEAQRVTDTGELRPLRLGLLASGAILARVDALILAGLTAAAIWPALRRVAASRRDAVRLAAGIAPAGLYFCVNLAVFGSLLPLSSTAKALAPAWIFNAAPLREAFTDFADPVVACAIALPAWFILGCAVAGLAAWRKCGGAARLPTVVCIFPSLFYLLLAVRSDWMIWEWYLYPIVLAVPFACVTFTEALRRRGTRLAARAASVVLLLLGVVSATLQVAGHLVNAHPGLNAMFTQAAALRPFIAAHPGLYAMGDQAGTVAFLSGTPLFQLEGLVEDRALLADIAARKTLLPVLRGRHVDYYIGTDMTRLGGCWESSEPKSHQAGPRSPKMTGRFCAPPLFGVLGPDHGHTFVFAVNGEKEGQ